MQQIPKGVDKGLLIQERKRFLAQNETNSFIERVIKNEKGDFITQGLIHRIIQHHITWCWDNNLHAGIQAPFGHGKSVQLSVGKPLQLIGNDVNIRIKTVCNSDDTAKGRLSTVQTYIDSSQEYKEIFPNVFPDKLEKWNNEELFVKRASPMIDPTLHAKGVLSTGIGGRCDVIIFDDLNDWRNTIQNPSMRTSIIDAFLNTWMTRLIANGKAVMIATRWHNEDVAGFIIKDTEISQRWAWLIIRVSHDKESLECELLLPSESNYDTWFSNFYNDKVFQKWSNAQSGSNRFNLPVWEHFNKDALIARHAEIGSKAYNRGFRQEPFTDEDRTFPHFSSNVVWDSTITSDELKSFKRIAFGIDLSGKKRKGTVLGIAGIDHENIKHFFFIKYMQYSSGGLMQLLTTSNTIYKPEVVILENNSQQQIAEDWLRTYDATADIPLRAFTTLSGNKFHPQLGLPSLDLEFENKRWRFHIPHPKINTCGCDYCRLINEMSNHPYYETSDGCMVVWFCNEGLTERKGGILEWLKSEYQKLNQDNKIVTGVV